MRIRTVVLGALLAFSTGSVGFAQSPGDVRYCSALSDSYKKHVLTSGSEGHDQPMTVEVAVAMANCESEAGAAIPVLEKTLINAQMNLPPRDGAVVVAAEAPAKPRATPVRPEDRMAANRGDPIAQYNLGLRYESGEGVPQDYALAHMWLNLSSASLAPISDKAAAARDALQQKKMTPVQVAEAQRLARDWKASK